MGRRSILVASLAVLLSGAWTATTRAADAPRPAPRDVSGVLRAPREKHAVPGMAAAVVRGGSLAATGSDGVRKAGADAKVAADDLWHLGSCTKAMTATLCGVLAEEGRLPFDATLGSVFPAEAKDMAPGWADVRLEWLLRNRGGAPASLDADGLWGRLWALEGPHEEMRRELLRGVTRHPPVHPPGTTFLYSNAGFAMAGAMAEKATGKAWEDLLRAKVFAPLGITTAGFGAPGRAGRTDQPWGHRPDGTPVEPGRGADNPAAIGPAGTVHMTVADWAKFAALHLEAARGRPRLLRAETFARLHEPPADGEYAMGWLRPRRDWAGGRVLTHAGSNTMWYCVAWIAPERDLAVLVCANRGGPEGERATDEAAWALIQGELAAPTAR